jgi:hypothetical protein
MLNIYIYINQPVYSAKSHSNSRLPPLGQGPMSVLPDSVHDGGRRRWIWSGPILRQQDSTQAHTCINIEKLLNIHVFSIYIYILDNIYILLKILFKACLISIALLVYYNVFYQTPKMYSRKSNETKKAKPRSTEHICRNAHGVLYHKVQHHNDELGPCQSVLGIVPRDPNWDMSFASCNSWVQCGSILLPMVPVFCNILSFPGNFFVFLGTWRRRWIEGWYF